MIGEQLVTPKVKKMRKLEKHSPAIEFASHLLGISSLIFICLFLFGHHEQAFYAAGVLGCATLSIFFNIVGSHQTQVKPPTRKESVE